MNPFSRRSTFIIIAVAVVSIAGIVVFMFTADHFRNVDSPHNNTFSRSALGHEAFVQLLKRSGIPVLVSRYETHERTFESGVLVVAEPDLTGSDDEAAERRQTFIDMLNNARTTLIVLPKRSGFPSSEDRDFISHQGLTDLDVPVRAISESQVSAALTRYRSADAMSWYTGPFSAEPTFEHGVQLMENVGGVPLIQNSDGVLLAEFESSDYAGGRILILSDPDLIATHGLADGDNPRLAVEIVEYARGDGGAVVLDETLHGFELPPSLMRELTQFPLNLATIQVLLLIALLAWASMGRFGAPEKRPTGLRPGKDFFIENTADLLRHGGHAAYTLERYIWFSIQQVGEAVHAPERLERYELTQWLQAFSAERGVPIDLRSLLVDAENMATGNRSWTPRTIVDMADEIHHWKREMLK